MTDGKCASQFSLHGVPIRLHSWPVGAVYSTVDANLERYLQKRRTAKKAASDKRRVSTGPSHAFPSRGSCPPPPLPPPPSRLHSHAHNLKGTRSHSVVRLSLSLHPTLTLSQLLNPLQRERARKKKSSLQFHLRKITSPATETATATAAASYSPPFPLTNQTHNSHTVFSLTHSHTHTHSHTLAHSHAHACARPHPQLPPISRAHQSLGIAVISRACFDVNQEFRPLPRLGLHLHCPSHKHASQQPCPAPRVHMQTQTRAASTC